MRKSVPDALSPDHTAKTRLAPIHSRQPTKSSRRARLRADCGSATSTWVMRRVVKRGASTLPRHQRDPAVGEVEVFQIAVVVNLRVARDGDALAHEGAEQGGRA